ncbi:MAG: DUF4173 domain-containing protein [Oscillospiraceae bacterium]|nr:DUF4173 domain-containing protein [Oscillospiraceae bacterium]
MNEAGYYPYEAHVLKNDCEYSKRERLYAFGAVVMGFLFIKLTAAPIITASRMGLGTTVFLLLALIFTQSFEERKKITPSKALRNILYVLFSANIFLSANLLIRWLCLIFALLILVYGSLAASDRKFEGIRRFFPIDIAAAIFRPLSDMSACPSAIRSAAEKNKAGKAIKNVVLGLAIALPSTIAAGVLLMSADSGFASILNSLADGGVQTLVIIALQAFIGLPVGFYIFALCHVSGESVDYSDEDCCAKIASMRFVPSGAAAFSAVPLCVLYVIFFFSQISYFLSSFASRLPAEMGSYSEYARRGFFELCLVSLINLAVIIAINLFAKYNEDGSRPVFLKIMSCILCIFTVLLIVTAVSKMAMYINVYGLTRLRCYTTWFMLLLGVLFVGIMISMLSPKFNLSKFAVTSFTIMFSILSFSNADRLIAEYNISRYLNGTLPAADITMFRELSADAVPAAEKLRGRISPEEELELVKIISKKLETAKEADMRTATLSEMTAEKYVHLKL